MTRDTAALPLVRCASALCAGGLLLTLGAAPSRAEQFVLFQQTFELTKASVDQAGSHYFVRGANLSQPPGNNWTAPVDYRNGNVHIRTEVLEKPAGAEPNHWSYCYMPNRPIGPGYGCAGSGKYTETGVYDRIEKMTSWWQNTAISWPQGIKEMHLVVKGMGDSGHLHKRADVAKLFPSKVRITMVQVSAGGSFNPSKVPGMDSRPFDAGAPGGGTADAGAPADGAAATGGASGEAGGAGPGGNTGNTGSGGNPGGGDPDPQAGGGSGGTSGGGTGGSAPSPGQGAPTTGTGGSGAGNTASGGASGTASTGGGNAPATSDGAGPVSGSGAFACATAGARAPSWSASIGLLGLGLVGLGWRRRKSRRA